MYARYYPLLTTIYHSRAQRKRYAFGILLCPSEFYVILVVSLKKSPAKFYNAEQKGLNYHIEIDELVKVIRDVGI